MEVALLSVTLVLSAVLAFVLCRAMLAALLALMNGGTLLPFVFHWKRVIFASALFWFWYLTPVLAASDTAARLMRFLTR